MFDLSISKPNFSGLSSLTQIWASHASKQSMIRCGSLLPFGNQALTFGLQNLSMCSWSRRGGKAALDRGLQLAILGGERHTWPRTRVRRRVRGRCRPGCRTTACPVSGSAKVVIGWKCSARPVGRDHAELGLGDLVPQLFFDGGFVADIGAHGRPSAVVNVRPLMAEVRARVPPQVASKARAAARSATKARKAGSLAASSGSRSR